MRMATGVILDFGLSRLRFETTRTLTDIQTSGTVRFLAPELSTGEENCRTTEKSDTYSLGMVIYQLLYGIIPFDNLPNEFAVVRSVIEGRTPRRSKTSWRSSHPSCVAKHRRNALAPHTSHLAETEETD